MGNIIEINNLYFNYKDNNIFNNFSLSIKKGEWITLTGPNGSGKTTLIKILSGLIITDSNIKISNILLNKNSIYEIRKTIGVVFDNLDNNFLCETVEEELVFPLENLCYSKKEMAIRLKELANIFNLEKIINKSINDLSIYEKVIISIASVLSYNPDILIMDETLSYLNNKEKEKILKILSLLNKKGLTIINSTHNLEESYNSDRLVVINGGKVILDNKPILVMEQEKELNKIGINLPFEVDLSLKLKLYDLLDSTVLNINEMVDLLWQ